MGNGSLLSHLNILQLQFAANSDAPTKYVYLAHCRGNKLAISLLIILLANSEGLAGSRGRSLDQQSSAVFCMSTVVRA